MTDDISRFSQGLQDLIFIRERLNAELEDELQRSEKLATAVGSLRRLNDASQTVIEDTLYRIGVWKEEATPPPLPNDRAAEMANRFAHQQQDSVKQVVNDSYRVN